MTRLDVIDTAVKIGLGAVPAGFFSLLLATRSHFHELNKEVMRRRQMLESISVDLEAFHQVVIEIRITHTTHRSGLDAAKIQPGKGPSNDRLHATISKLTDNLKVCHTLEGKLLLLGMR